MTQTNKERFSECYRKHLRAAVTAKPDDYAYIAGREDEVAEKMLAAVEKKLHNKAGYAFKATCKELGIAHTYKAIDAYWRA